MKLKIAACQFPVDGDIASNENYIRRQMKAAAKGRATVVHFPECALGGYAGWDLDSFKGYDWKALRAATKRVIELAKELNLWVILEA